MSQAILLVDDEPHVLRALSRVLSMTGGAAYDVETCACGEDAVELLRRCPYDLVVTDLRMGGMDGLALLAHIRELRPETATVLITGFGSGQVEAAAQQWATAYLTKPFSLNEFVRCVRRVLQEKRPVASPKSFGRPLDLS